MNKSEKKDILVGELCEYFVGQNFHIISAQGINDVKYPQPLHNDGYGDQEDKRPEILAFDPREKCYIIGITRTGKPDLATDESLTEYNVFLDQTDVSTHVPYRLYVNVPSNLVVEFCALIREYIHREYWHRIMVIGSHKIDE